MLGDVSLDLVKWSFNASDVDSKSHDLMQRIELSEFI